MRRIAIIGAGSLVFCKTLILDVLATPGMQETEFILMAPSTRRTSQVGAFVQQVIAAHSLPAKVVVTTDRREALRGASYVIATFQIGGLQAFEADYAVPMRHGVDQCIGDSLGPGGILRMARTWPVYADLVQDMMELCPDALLLNYVNPMAMVCWALGETGIRSVGLCHGVQTTLDLIAGYSSVPKSEIEYTCAGINHMAWFLELRHHGRDLYPALREKFEDPAYYANEKVRGEVFRHFGYLMTESTGHLSEYLPYFRKNQEALDLYCDEPGFGGASGAYYKFSAQVEEKHGAHLLEGEPIALPPRSVEYGSYIIEAIEMNRTFRFNGNVRNNGLISNLPDDCCGEMTIFADGTGLHPTRVGDLPPQCAALNLTNINAQRIGVLAAKTGDPETLMQAIALDPLTAAILTLKQIREMTADLLEAEKPWLPQFAGKTLRPLPTISIPKDLKRVDVPADPALAILARFGQLGS
jgi:alpha-galactosidase